MAPFSQNCGISCFIESWFFAPNTIVGLFRSVRAHGHTRRIAARTSSNSLATSRPVRSPASVTTVKCGLLISVQLESAAIEGTATKQRTSETARSEEHTSELQ